MTPLDAEFETLHANVLALIGVLEEADERFWVAYLRRGLRLVDERKLAGATAVLGCYGGAETLSDLVIGRRFETDDPVRFRNLNARLSYLRNETFAAADAIASRRSW